MPKTDEKVMCVPAAALEALGTFHGVTLDVKRYLPLLLGPKTFQPRSTCETDPSYKQIIPYHVFVRSGKILYYARTKQSGETRLVSKISVGIGGHINEEDTEDRLLENGLTASAYLMGAIRELDEELTVVSTTITNRVQGFVYDDTDEVSRVHLGVIHVVHLDDTGGLASEDPAIKLLGFETPGHTPVCGGELETWSQHIMNCQDLNGLLAGDHGVSIEVFLKGEE